jgi:hypothetical protein
MAVLYVPSGIYIFPYYLYRRFTEVILVQKISITAEAHSMRSAATKIFTVLV